MRVHAGTISGAMLVSALALAGCGSGGAAPAAVAPAAMAHIEFASKAVKDNAMPALYTCDGRDISPPLEWGAVPSTVSQLALFVVGYTPEPTTHTNKVSIEWAVAGLNPSLHRLAPGKLPPGAVVGLDSSGKPGYSVCPESGKLVHYQFELYGMPSSVSVSPNFGGVQVITALSGNSGSARARAYGVFVAVSNG